MALRRVILVSVVALLAMLCFMGVVRYHLVAEQTQLRHAFVDYARRAVTQAAGQPQETDAARLRRLREETERSRRETGRSAWATRTESLRQLLADRDGSE